jgi:hypothetical protein
MYTYPVTNCWWIDHGTEKESKEIVNAIYNISNERPSPHLSAVGDAAVLGNVHHDDQLRFCVVQEYINKTYFILVFLRISILEERHGSRVVTFSQALNGCT